MILASLFSVALGYVLGCFPSAYIAGRLLRGVDIRELGDGNMGSANAFRQLGARAGIAVAIADVGKGAAAMLIATLLAVPGSVLLLTGVAAVAGHNWPVFLRFKGGRGEATAIGVLLTVLPREMFILFGVALVPFAITRSVIFTSAFLFSPLPLVAWWFGESGGHIAYSIALPCLVGFTHFLTTRHAPSKLKERGSN